MPLSKRILRGQAAEELPSLEFDKVGPFAQNPVESLFIKLGRPLDREPEPAPITEEELRMLEWEERLKAREQAIAELEQQTIREATELGQQRGYEAGWDAADHERIQLVQAAQSLNGQFESFKTHLGEKILDLASLVAQKVVADTLAVHPEHAAKMLEEVLESMSLSAHEVTLYAHPTTLQAIEAQFTNKADLAGIKLKADPGLLEAGFKLHHPEGEIDVSMESRWAAVLEGIGRSLPGEEHPAEQNRRIEGEPPNASTDGGADV